MRSTTGDAQHICSAVAIHEALYRGKERDMRPFLVMAALVALALPACNCGAVGAGSCTRDQPNQCVHDDIFSPNGQPVYEKCVTDLQGGYEWLPVDCSGTGVSGVCTCTMSHGFNVCLCP